MSRAQVDLLYSHYHRRHIDALNARQSPDDNLSLAALANTGDETVRHHAQEAWNLVFFWHGLSARGVEVPGALARRIDTAFGGVGALQYQWRSRWPKMPTESTIEVCEESISMRYGRI